MAHHPCSSAVSFQEARVLGPWLRGAAAGPANANAAICTPHAVAPELLQGALALECSRHDAFLTRFSLAGDDGLTRHVGTPGATQFQLQQTSIGSAVDDPAVADAVSAFCKSAFLMDDGQWLRVLLVHVADGASVLVFRMPHVVSDAASMRLLIANVWCHYEALAIGQIPAARPTRFSLQDYAASQQAWAQSAEFPRQLDALIEHTQATFDRMLRAEPNAIGDARLGSRPMCAAWSVLDRDVQARFELIAQRTKTSMQMTLMAAAAVALARVCQRRAFCFRMPFSGRLGCGTEQLVGFLANDLPMFVSVDPAERFESFVRTIQKDALSVMRYGAVPWHLLNERLHALGMSQAFDDYLINVIPSFDSFGQSERFRTESFRIPATGKTTGILKVLMQGVDKGIRVTLRVGEEDSARTQQQLLPEFLRILTELAAAPDMPLQHVLD